MKKYSLLFFSILILLSSCKEITSPIKDLIDDIFSDNPKASETDNSKPTIRKTYFEKSGDLKTEITVVNNKKNGPAKKYYASGELHTLIHYHDNIKEGETIWYYKNGKPYRVTQYVNGKIEGIRKIFYEDGKLQAEIPFKNGKLIEGTKEYTTNRNLISDSRKIIFETNDLTKFEGKYILKMRLSKRSKKVEFFEEKHSTTGTKIMVPINAKKGVGTIEYFIVSGSYKMSILKIYAKYKTNLGNPILKSTSYNLAIDN